MCNCDCRVTLLFRAGRNTWLQRNLLYITIMSSLSLGCISVFMALEELKF